MRDLIKIIESAEAAADPVVAFKPIGPKWKDIYIDGVKAGFISKDTHAVGVGLHGGSRGTNTRKIVLWSGEFTFDGIKMNVGRTENVSALKPKIERMIRSYLVRKASEQE